MTLESVPRAATLVSLQANATTSAGPLPLKGLEPFAVGGRRLCFVHPHEPAKCVKVLRTDERRTVRHKKTLIPANWRREYDNNAHEKRVLEQLERRIGPAMASHLPRCYGMAETDLGPGLVLDLVRDDDGAISRSIRELITVGYDLSKLRRSFDDFGRFLAEHLVITRGLLDHNLVVAMRGGEPGPIFMIDGLGDPAWLPLSRWIPALGRARIARRIEEAWTRFESFAARGGVSEELRRTSSWDQGFLRHRG